MSEPPVYFVVERFHGREVPSVIRGHHDPKQHFGHPLAGIARLDRLPNCADLLRLTTRQLHALWKAGALSP